MASAKQRLARLEARLPAPVDELDDLTDAEMDQLMRDLNATLLPVVRQAIFLNEREATADRYRSRLAHMERHMQRDPAVPDYDDYLSPIEFSRTWQIIEARWSDALRENDRRRGVAT